MAGNKVSGSVPGGAKCSVIVTSRRDLSGLVTAHGARSVPLDVLDRVSARQLLARHLGPRRLAAEPKVAEELLRCSVGLPLALGIVAARASTNPCFPLVLLADALRDTTTRLDGLDAGDTDSSVRAVLSWSHAGLSDDAAHLFGLLGGVPGPDIAVMSVCSLDSQPAARTRLLLHELEAAHLVLQHVPGRYKMHDLIRLYAREQSAALDLRPALTRLFEHYLNTAACAVRVHYPHGRHSSPPEETRPVPDISDPGAATAWIEAERPNLVAITRFAAEHGCPILPNRLSTTMWAYLLNHSHHHDALFMHTYALRVSRRAGDRAGECRALINLCACYVLLDRADEASSSLQQALALSRELGDRAAEALTLTFLGAFHGRTRCYADALAALKQSVAVSRRLGDRCLEAKAFNELGKVYSALGDDGRAIGCHCFAIVRARSIGDAYQLGRAHERLARAHERHGSRGDVGHHRREAAEAFQSLTLPPGAVVQTML